MTAELDRELEFYKSNKERFLAEYKDKVVVLKGQKVIGIFEDKIAAFMETKKKHEPGTFLVQKVTKDSHIFFHSWIWTGKKDAA